MSRLGVVHTYVSQINQGSQLVFHAPSTKEGNEHWHTGPEILYTAIEVEWIKVDGHEPLSYHRGMTHSVITFDGLPWPVIMKLSDSVGGYSAPTWHGED